MQLEAAEKAEKLTSALEQSDHWLEISESAVGLVQEMLSIHQSSSDPRLDQLIEEIASLRNQLTEATKMITSIREGIAGTSEQQPLEERIQQAVQIALRVVATLGTVDTGLERLTNRLGVTQNHVQEMHADVKWWILLAASGITLLSLWMAAGQVALFRLAWIGNRAA